MSTRSIARRYARALFELEQEGVEVRASLHRAAEVVAVEEITAVLAQPQVPSTNKAGMISRVAGDISDEVQRLLEILCARNKAALLPEIDALLEEMARQVAKEVDAEVITAAEIDSAMQAQIATSLGASTGYKVKLHVSHDAAILGGMVIRVGDRQIDYSLRTRLEGLRRAMVA